MMTTDDITHPMEALFKTYNEAVENGYNHFFHVSGNKEIPAGMENSDETLQRCLHEFYEKWEKTPMPALGGMTPFEYFERLNDFELLMELFPMGSKICDVGLPAVYLDKLKSYGQRAVDRLLQIASESPAVGVNDEAAMVPLMAVKVLGDWKVSEAADVFVKMLSEGMSNELFMEKIRDALVSIGHACVDPIIGALDACDDIGDSQEYLLMALSDIGTDGKTDRIYRCLKSTFLKMHNKVTGALCLGNYGDGRAIPVLRGYLEKNNGKLSKEAFGDIKFAVHMLGGSAEDILFVAAD